MLRLLHLNVSKVDRFVVHGMRVRSGWRHRGDVWGRHGPTASALARESNALGARSLASYAGIVWALASPFDDCLQFAGFVTHV